MSQTIGGSVKVPVYLVLSTVLVGLLSLLLVLFHIAMVFADLLMTSYIHYKVYENTEVMPHNPQVNIDSSITNHICHFAHSLMLSQLASTG
jgi:hypothetical protein